MPNQSSTELKELVKTVYQATMQETTESRDTLDKLNVCCSEFFRVHGTIVSKDEFYDLIKEILNDEMGYCLKEQDRIAAQIKYYRWVLDSFEHQRAKDLRPDRFNKLMQGEPVEECPHILSKNDQEYYNVVRHIKRIEELAEAYWSAQIDRDQLLKAIDSWNKRKSSEQRDIKLGYIFASIQKNWKCFPMPNETPRPLKCINSSEVSKYTWINP
jgi:hypothetical protein